MTEKIKTGDWVRIADTEHTGRVTSVNDDGEGYVISRPDQRWHWVIPGGLLERVEHPSIEHAAAGILDELASFDPAWRQDDTLGIRRRIALVVADSLGWRPGVDSD